jgi:hypothetical protein
MLKSLGQLMHEARGVRQMKKIRDGDLRKLKKILLSECRNKFFSFTDFDFFLHFPCMLPYKSLFAGGPSDYLSLGINY